MGYEAYLISTIVDKMAARMTIQCGYEAYLISTIVDEDDISRQRVGAMKPI